MKGDNKFIIKVAGKSSVPGVSGSIIKSVEEGKAVELHSIGASAISQCVKAMTSARGILARKGYDVYFISGFGTTMRNNQEKTMIIFKLIVK